MGLYIPGGAGFLPSTVWQVFVLINIFGGDCLKPGWIFMKHQQDSTEVCGCGDKVLLLAQIKDFRFLGFDNCCISQNSSPKCVSSTWPAPGHFSPMVLPTFPTRPSNCQPWQPCRLEAEIHGGKRCLDSACPGKWGSFARTKHRTLAQTLPNISFKGWVKIVCLFWMLNL